MNSTQGEKTRTIILSIGFSFLKIFSLVAVVLLDLTFIVIGDVINL